MSDDQRSMNNLHEISTQWSKLQDIHIFVLRYAGAIERYLQFLLRDEEDGREAAQGFLLKIVETGFRTATPDKGRFRNYLMRAVQNAAHQYVRDKQRVRTRLLATELFEVPTVDASLEQAWLDEWRTCILDRAWKRLKNIERTEPNNYHWTVLQAATENVTDRQGDKLDSTQLAAQVSQQLDQPMTAEAFRKQLSRARRSFAKILVDEVRETLDDPSEEMVREELQTAGLWSLIKDYVG